MEHFDYNVLVTQDVWNSMAYVYFSDFFANFYRKFFCYPRIPHYEIPFIRFNERQKSVSSTQFQKNWKQQREIRRLFKINKNVGDKNGHICQPHFEIVVKTFCFQH